MPFVTAQKYFMAEVVIEVVFVPCNQPAFVWAGHATPEMTIEEALLQSGLYDLYPETRQYAVGIFAKQVSRDTPIKPGDRIEVYRPLLHSPMENRRYRSMRDKRSPAK